MTGMTEEERLRLAAIPHEHRWPMYWDVLVKREPIIADNASCAICGTTPAAVASKVAIAMLQSEVDAWREVGRQIKTEAEAGLKHQDELSDTAYSAPAVLKFSAILQLLRPLLDS